MALKLHKVNSDCNLSISEKFVDGIEDAETKKKVQSAMHNFEFSCIISDFESSLKVFDFELDNELKEGLQTIHNVIKQTVMSKLGLRLLEKTTSDKGDMQSIQMLVQLNSNDETAGKVGFASFLQGALSK